MENINQSYDIIYKNLAGRNLMVYIFKGEDELLNYQLGMLANNRINGLLKSDVIRINGEIHLQYDITSLVPIKKLFERKKLSRKDFIYLIEQIFELLGMMEQYLLDSGGIVFDSTYIFINPQSLELGHVYLPTKDRPQDLDLLKNFLLEAIINDIRFIDEPSDNFIQRLIEILKDPEFEATTLKRYLNEMYKAKPAVTTNKRIERALPKKEIDIQLSTHYKETAKVFERPKTKKQCYPIKSYVVLYSVIGTLVLFCIVLMLTGVLSPSNPDSLLSLLGFILIGGAVTYLVYSKLFSPDKKIERVTEENLEKKGQVKGAEYVNKAFSVPVPGNTVTYKESAVHREAASAMARKSSFPFSKQNGLDVSEIEISETNKFYSGIKSPKTQDRTVILNADNLNFSYLKRMLGNCTETIIIKQFPFMMGRLEGQVDYCINNPAVGKLHAEITKANESHFISDMNSRNGTIINGVRIEPTKENIIKNGDRITLGNEEFIFYCRDTDTACKN